MIFSPRRRFSRCRRRCRHAIAAIEHAERHFACCRRCHYRSRFRFTPPPFSIISSLTLMPCAALLDGYIFAAVAAVSIFCRFVFSILLLAFDAADAIA